MPFVKNMINTGSRFAESELYDQYSKYDTMTLTHSTNQAFRNLKGRKRSHQVDDKSQIMP